MILDFLKSYPRDAQNILCCFREKFENLQACSCVNGVIIGNRHCKKLFHKYAMRIFAKLFANSLTPMFILFVSKWAKLDFFLHKTCEFAFPLVQRQYVCSESIRHWVQNQVLCFYNLSTDWPRVSGVQCFYDTCWSKGS